MTVRAKMRCTTLKREYADQYDPETKKSSPGEHQVVVLHAVADSDETNKSWTKWTPSGEVSLHITNQEAVKQFELGKSYYVDFTPVD